MCLRKLFNFQRRDFPLPHWPLAISIWPKGPASLINISSVLMSLAISRLVAEPLMVHLSDFRQDTDDTYPGVPRWFNISPGTDYHGMRLVSRNKSKNNHKKTKPETGGSRTSTCAQKLTRPDVLGAGSKHPPLLSLLVYYIPFLCSFPFLYAFPATICNPMLPFFLSFLFKFSVLLGLD